jgi:hypothetical protein
MKTICIAIALVSACLSAWAQLPPTTPPPPVQPPSRVTPGAPGTNIVGGAGEDRVRTNLNPNLATNLPLSGLTNALGFTNAFGLTNSLGLTNDLRGTNRLANFGVTNKLATLPPEQVRAVKQVQSSLDLLQQGAAKLRDTPNIQEAIDQSPSLQQQVGIITAELNALPQGTTRPSQEAVERLSRHLVRALVNTELADEQQLVVSAAINQIANSSNLTQAEIDENVATVQAVLRSGGAPAMVVDPVTRDLRAFAVEVQRGSQ